MKTYGQIAYEATGGSAWRWEYLLMPEDRAEFETGAAAVIAEYEQRRDDMAATVQVNAAERIAVLEARLEDMRKIAHRLLSTKATGQVGFGVTPPNYDEQYHEAMETLDAIERGENASPLWSKLRESKAYREELVASQLKRGIPFQIRSMMKERGWSQEALAQESGISQGVISRAANPEYGNLTLNTIIRVAAGFDVAFVGKFAAFSELERWFIDLSEDIRIENFKEEDSTFENVRQKQQTYKGGPAVEK